MSKNVALLSVMMVLAVLPGCSTEEPRSGDRPNVVLIVLDTTRPDYLGLGGHDEPTSPFLDGLAKRSVVLQEAVSTSSWTAPSTASVFTGLYPTHHGLVQGTLAHRSQMRELAEKGKATIPLNRIPGDVHTLPEIFQAAGYATFGCATNLNIGEEMGFARGFDWFRKIHGDENRIWYTKYAPYGTGKEVQITVSKMEDRIRKAEPYFLYLHLNDAHSPYRFHVPWYAPWQEKGADKTEAYESEIGYMDRILGEIYERLGLRDNTIIAVVSDHGEAFGEHGYGGHPGWLHAEVNNVVFMISWPGGDLDNTAPEYRASLVDVFPTLLELAGLEYSGEIDGVSLARTFKRGTGDELVESLQDRTLFAHRVRGDDIQVWSAMQGKWKLMTVPDAAPQLFNVERDPKETEDLAAQEREIVSDLLAQLTAFQETTVAEGAKTSIEIDEAELERLKTLGYFQ